MHLRHTWTILSQEEQPSTLEQYKAAGASLTAKRAQAHEMVMITTRPVIVTYRCECGAEKVVRL